VVFGKATGTAIELSSIAGGTGGFVIINGQCKYDGMGFTVSSAGDINGDGLADLIVGASGSATATGASVGRSFVVFGKTATGAIDLSAVAAGIGGFVINGQCEWDTSGVVSSAGDVNGDGLADLIVGAPFHDPSGRSNAGSSYVIFGGTTGVFEQTAVDWLGTDGADMQSDNGIASTLVAGAGQDMLTADAASVLYGGAGHDSFWINQAMITALQSPMGSGGNVDQLARIDGGSGTDQINLNGAGLTLDLTLVANQAASNPDGGSRIDSVEIFNITGVGNNTLKLTAKDVLELGSAKLFNPASSRQQLQVLGNKGDTLDLADSTGTSGWVKENKPIYIGYAGPSNVWNHKDSLATVYVSADVSVI
jgi:hypothetical protein